MMIFPSAIYLSHYLFILLAFGESLPFGSSLQGRPLHTIISLSLSYIWVGIPPSSSLPSPQRASVLLSQASPSHPASQRHPHAPE